MKLWQSLLLKIFLTPLAVLVVCLPRRIELWMGAQLGLIALKFVKRREVARENIKHCFPGRSAEDRELLLKENFQHYGIIFFELLHLLSPFPGHYRRYAQTNTVLEGLENWQRAQAKKRGVIFVSSHLGSWELMAAGGGLAGIPLTMATKHLKPEWLHKRIETNRLSCGARGVYEPRTLPTIMRALRNGESVGFVMDQYAGPPLGIPVPFFGVKVGTLAAVSVLVERTQAAVVPVKTHRDACGLVHICFLPELDLTAVVSDNEKCTAFLTQQVESWVRENPAQWLWVHRRFKNVVWPQELT